MAAVSDDDVCDEEANRWRVCMENSLGNKSARKMCLPCEHAFDSCILSWRAKVGPDVRIKGMNEGDPPLQCAAMSCLVGSCLRTFNYDFDRCKEPMDCFKKCVKAYFGDEYIR